MVILILGAILIGFSAVLDSLFRARMTRIGHKWALLEGGAFDYTKYHRERKEHGWAAWPVYLMWAAGICGIALLVGGFFSYFGTSPASPR
jgi:hypothetical protein